MFKKSTCQPSCKRRRHYQIQYKHESLSWGERETSQIQIQKSKKTRLISQSKTFKSSWEFCRYSNSLLLPSSRISLNNTLPFLLHSYHVFSFLGFFFIFFIFILQRLQIALLSLFISVWTKHNRLGFLMSAKNFKHFMLYDVTCKLLLFCFMLLIDAFLNIVIHN